jgi:hypothetical protein
LEMAAQTSQLEKLKLSDSEEKAKPGNKEALLLALPAEWRSSILASDPELKKKFETRPGANKRDRILSKSNRSPEPKRTNEPKPEDWKLVDYRKNKSKSRSKSPFKGEKPKTPRRSQEPYRRSERSQDRDYRRAPRDSRSNGNDVKLNSSRERFGSRDPPSRGTPKIIITTAAFLYTSMKLTRIERRFWRLIGQ